MNNKKILMVGLFPPHQNGGGEIQTYNLAKALRSRNYSIFVLSMGKGRFYESYENGGIKIYRIGKFKQPRKKTNILEVLKYLTIEIFHPIFFIFTIYLILKHKIKLVHISSINQISLAPLIAAKLLFRKIIVTLHGHELLSFYSTFLPDYGKRDKHSHSVLKHHIIFPRLQKNYIFKKILEAISDLLIDLVLPLKFTLTNFFANWIVFPSNYAKKIHLKYGLMKNKAKTIYNFAAWNNSNNESINALKKTLSKNNEKVILFVGTLIEEKGPQILLKAFNKIYKKNKKIKLIFVGEGNLEDKLKNYVKKSSLNSAVTFVGRIPYDSINAYYELSNIVVIPSLIPETFSLVFLEASLSKKVILASKIGALEELISEGKNGFLFEPNVENLHATLNYTIENFSKLKYTGKNAAKFVTERCSVERSLKTYEVLFGS